jgi:hypothetical protein
LAVLILITKGSYMKIFLLPLILLASNQAHAQHSFTFTGSSISSGTSAVSNSSETVLTFFQSGGRLAYTSNSDTFYLEPIPQDQKVFSYFQQVGQSATEGLPTIGTPFHLSANDMESWVSSRTALTGPAADYIQAAFSCQGCTTMSTFPTNHLVGNSDNLPTAGLPIHLSADNLATWMQSQTALTDPTPTFPAVFSCQGCTTMSTFPTTQFVGIDDDQNTNIVKNLDINTLAAYYPNSNNAWLTAHGADSGIAITSLTVYTGSVLLPNNLNGSITISQLTGSQFGLATDSTGGRIGWLSTSGGTLTFRDGNILTNANLIDYGLITAAGIAITDHSWTAAPALGNIQGLFSSNSPAGNGILVANAFSGPDANTFITLQQGEYANTLMTVSSFSTDSRYPAGSFVMVSRGPNGIQFDVESNGAIQAESIRFSFDGEEYARFERGIGFISQHPMRYPRYSTAQRKALTNVEPGEMVYDTDKKRYFGFGDSGWYSISMKRER